eukprot:g26244.t1
MIDTLVEHRGENRPLQLRQDALSNLIQLLDNLTSEEAADSLLMLDQNGRAILHKAAMFDDVELLEVLWQYGGAGTVTLQASRDSDGFTAVMQERNITSVPSITEPSAPRLGRGSFGWTGPSGEDFGGLPKVSPMPNTTTWVWLGMWEETTLKKEQEEEEADCQALVLRVARRHMWRERSKRMKLRPTRPIRSKVPSELFALAKMEDEASLLVKGIEKRQSELAAAIKQQQECVRGEIAVWNKRVTDLEMQHVQARAVDEHRGNLSTQVHAGAQPAAVGLQTGSPQKVLIPLSPSPGSSLLPVRQPGSHLVPSGSLRLPPQVPGANMVRMVNSYSAGQLPKAGSFLTPAAAPNLQVQSLAATMPGTHPVSSCPSFRPVETEGAPQVPQS